MNVFIDNGSYNLAKNEEDAYMCIQNFDSIEWVVRKYDEKYDEEYPVFAFEIYFTILKNKYRYSCTVYCKTEEAKNSVIEYIKRCLNDKEDILVSGCFVGYSQHSNYHPMSCFHDGNFKNNTCKRTLRNMYRELEKIYEYI